MSAPVLGSVVALAVPAAVKAVPAMLVTAPAILPALAPSSVLY
jgi:hypothetical protein